MLSSSAGFVLNAPKPVDMGGFGGFGGFGNEIKIKIYIMHILVYEVVIFIFFIFYFI